MKIWIGIFHKRNEFASLALAGRYPWLYLYVCLIAAHEETFRFVLNACFIERIRIWFMLVHHDISRTRTVKKRNWFNIKSFILCYCSWCVLVNAAYTRSSLISSPSFITSSMSVIWVLVIRSIVITPLTFPALIHKLCQTAHASGKLHEIRFPCLGTFGIFSSELLVWQKHTPL